MSNQVKRMVQRAIAAFTALALGVGLSITSLLTPVTAHAFTASGGQLQSRAIYMSKSTPAATGVSYIVSFKPTVTTTVKGFIVDFCSGSPIVGDSTCGAPSGFTVGTPTVTTSALTSGVNSPISTTALGGGAWTAASLNSGRTLKLTNSTGFAPTLATTYGFVISTVTNPSQATPATSGTFYARILSYDNDASGDITTYAPGTEGTTDLIDYGGIALSTAYNINITAKVQESLTFCTSAADLSGATNNDCTHATNPALTLGHGSPAVLTNTAVDAASAYTQASTNAQTGIAIRMHATNTCTGLSSDGGTSCGITGLNNTSAGSVSAGTTFFGLFVAASATTSGVGTSSGKIIPDANYNDGSHTTVGSPATVFYGMDNTANSGVTSTYGDLIATSDPGVTGTGGTGSGPLSQVNNQLLFAATAGLTVPAGIYTGQESLIATGTF